MMRVGSSEAGRVGVLGTCGVSLALLGLRGCPSAGITQEELDAAVQQAVQEQAAQTTPVVGAPGPAGEADPPGDAGPAGPAGATGAQGATGSAKSSRSYRGDLLR